MFEQTTVLENKIEKHEKFSKIKIFQEQSSPEGGGDGVLVEEKNNGKEITLFDLKGHGQKVEEKKKKFEQILKKTDNPEELHESLKNLETSASVGKLRLENNKLEVISYAGEIFFIIRDNTTGKIKSNIIFQKNMQLFDDDLPKHQFKLGSFIDPKKKPGKVLDLPKDANVIMMTDGVLSGAPDYAEENENWESGDPTNFEKDLIKFAQENKNLSGEDFYKKFEELVKKNLKNRDSKITDPELIDDASMIFINLAN